MFILHLFNYKKKNADAAEDLSLPWDSRCIKFDIYYPCAYFYIIITGK